MRVVGDGFDQKPAGVSQKAAGHAAEADLAYLEQHWVAVEPCVLFPYHDLHVGDISCPSFLVLPGFDVCQ